MSMMQYKVPYLFLIDLLNLLYNLTIEIGVDDRGLVVSLNDGPDAIVRYDGSLHLDAAVPGRGRVEPVEGREKWLLRGWMKFISAVFYICSAYFA